MASEFQDSSFQFQALKRRAKADRGTVWSGLPECGVWNAECGITTETPRRRGSRDVKGMVVRGIGEDNSHDKHSPDLAMRVCSEFNQWLGQNWPGKRVSSHNI